MRLQSIPELLNMLDIKGKSSQLMRWGCQKDIAEKIQKQGGDYFSFNIQHVKKIWDSCNLIRFPHPS